jgi:hypothetical protein
VGEFTEKYGEERLIMLYKSMIYFEDAELDEDPVLLKQTTWDSVKHEIMVKAKSL